jgi:hypothetical protein
MSYTKKELPYSRQKYLTFLATGGSVANTGSTMIETWTMSNAFELEKVRLRLSTAHASAVDLMVEISHHLGSYYNHKILSEAMAGKQDVLLQLDPTLKLFQGDAVNASMVLSAANHYGLEFSGWAITSG